MKYTNTEAQAKWASVRFDGEYFYIGAGAVIGAGADIGVRRE